MVHGIFIMYVQRNAAGWQFYDMALLSPIFSLAKTFSRYGPVNYFLDRKRGCECTCEVLLQQILKAEEHHFIELGALLASAFKVGVDFADIWRVLFVVCNLEYKKQTDVMHNQ